MHKILLISHGLGNGGAERASSILSNSLFRLGYEIIYVAVYHNDITYHLDEGIKYIYINSSAKNKFIRYCDRTLKICDIIRKTNPDRIISFLVQEMVLPTIIHGHKIIFSERTDPMSEPLPLRILNNFCFSNCYKIVFQTRGAKECFNNKIKNKSMVIGNAIEKNLPLWKRECHEKTIVTACRITKDKNIQMLIKAFMLFYQHHRDYELNIYGFPTDRQVYSELENMIASNNMENKIHLLGYSNSVQEHISNSEIFVLTSNYEGLSNAMLESLCIGIPTICTDCPPGGASEYITDGVNGFLVPVGDYYELYKKMLRIAEDVDLQYAFSINAIKLREKLSTDRITNLWLKALE